MEIWADQTINDIIMYISEVVGSDFAFRQAPRNREIVSCRASMRALCLSAGNAARMKAAPFSFLARGPVPFHLRDLVSSIGF